MVDKNLLIVNGSSCEKTVEVSPTKKVSFHPIDSDHTVSVCFIGRVPFSDWGSSKCKTGAKGKALTGKVRSKATGDYHYTVESTRASKGAKPAGPRVNPQLIVDGGQHALLGKKRAKPGKKTARKK